MTAGGAERRPRGLVERVAAAYWDFSAAARAVIAERPSEAVLLSFFVVAGLVRFAGRAMGAVLAGGALEPGAAAAAFVGNLLWLPLGGYLAAWALAFALRRAGGQGDAYATRAALAWSLVAATPAWFALALIEGVDHGLAPELVRFDFAAQVERLAASPPAALRFAAALALSLLTAYITSAGLAAAHGFARPSRVLLGLAFGGLVLMAGLAGVAAVLDGGAAAAG